MLMSKDFLISGTEVAHDFFVYTSNMAMQIRPAHTSNVAVFVKAVVSKQKNAILVDILVFITNTQIDVGTGKVSWPIVLISLVRLVGEDNICCFCSAMRTGFLFIQCP